MDEQQEFKQTEIGRIPKEWEVVRLKESEEIDFIMGQSPPGKSYNEKGEGLPFIQGKAEFGNMYPSPILWTTQPTKIAEEGDVLISVRAPVGDVNICPYRLCIGRGLASIRIKKGSNIFYFYWFQKEKQRIENIGKGSTFKAITKDELSNIFLPLPPLPEQKKIAEILSTVDNAIEKVDESIAKTERLKKGLMQELLTRGIGHKDFKQTEIGRIPKEWEVVRMEEVISSFHNGIWGEEPIKQEKSYPVIRSTEITHDGKIVLSTIALRRIPEEKVSKYSLKDGDILLVASSGSSHLIGRTALFKQFNENEVYLFSNFMLRLRPKNVNSDFLFYYLNSKAYYFFLRRQQQTSTGLRNFPKKEFVKFPIPLPPLPEQKKIAEILSTVDKRMDFLRKKKERLERVKKGLMNDLLTGRRRVKI